MSIIEEVPGKQYRVFLRGPKRADGTCARKTERVHGGIRAARAAEDELKKTMDVWGADTSLAGRKVKTVGHYVPIFLAGKEREGIEPSTLRNYRKNLDRFLVPALGAVKLTAVTTAQLRQLFDDVGGMRVKDPGVKLSGTTRRGPETVIKMFFRQAYHDQLVPRDPAGPIKRTKADTPKKHVLTYDDAEAFIAHVEGTPVYLPAHVLYATGMRPEELLALMWDDVDFDAGTIEVQRALTAGADGRPAFKSTKSEAGERKLYLQPGLIALLRTHRSWLAAQKLRYEPGLWEDTPMVFPATRGSRGGYLAGRIWTYGGFSQSWQRARMKKDEGDRDWLNVGDPPGKVTPYTLRHTWVNHRLIEGVRLEVVSVAIGHKNSAITLGAYGGMMKGEAAQVMAPFPSAKGSLA
jgi:integrase